MLLFLEDLGTAASGPSHPKLASFEETLRQLLEWHAFYDEEHRSIRNLLDASFVVASAQSLCSKALGGASEALASEKDVSKQTGTTTLAAGQDLLSAVPVPTVESASTSKTNAGLGGFGEVGFDSSLNRLLRHFWYRSIGLQIPTLSAIHYYKYYLTNIHSNGLKYS